MEEMGKLLMGLGLVLFVVGGAVWLAGKVSGDWRLPGDLTIQIGNGSCFLSLTTALLLSLILTLVLNILFRIFIK